MLTSVHRLVVAASALALFASACQTPMPRIGDKAHEAKALAKLGLACVRLHREDRARSAPPVRSGRSLASTPPHSLLVSTAGRARVRISTLGL